MIESARLCALIQAAGHPTAGLIIEQWNKLRHRGNPELERQPAPSRQTIDNYLSGRYDDTHRKAQTEPRMAALEHVLRTLRQDRDERLRESYLQQDQILRSRRSEFATMMNAYYGSNPLEGGACGLIGYRSADLTELGGDATAPELLAAVAGGMPALLIVKRDWVPRQLTPLATLDTMIRLRPPKTDGAMLAPNLAKDVARLGVRKCEDDMTYQLIAIEAGGDAQFGSLPRMTFEISSYYAYYNNGEALAWELARQYCELDARWRRGPNEDLTTYLHRASGAHGRRAMRDFVARSLPLRSSVQPLELGRGLGVGVNTLTVLCSRGSSGHVFPMHERGVFRRATPAACSPGEAAGMLHVIPAGTFQPLTSQHAYGPQAERVEFSLQRTVFREFCEELLAREALIRENTLQADPDYIFRADPLLAKANSLFRQGRARAFFLACGLDVVTCKFEVLTLLLVDRDAFDQEGLAVHLDNSEGALENRPLRTFSTRELEEVMRNERLLPAGAGCIAFAHVRFDEIQGEIARLLAE